MADLSKIPLSRIQDFSDIIDNKQNKLVAGTNITIDNTNPDSPVISSTGGGGGGGRSIGEVFYSQSSLAEDNPGALPLFTGETIASANTIYPDFYNWVTSHTELQCTSAKYESALSTYGECPKYVLGTEGIAGFCLRTDYSGDAPDGYYVSSSSLNGCIINSSWGTATVNRNPIVYFNLSKVKNKPYTSFQIYLDNNLTQKALINTGGSNPTDRYLGVKYNLDENKFYFTMATKAANTDSDEFTGTSLLSSDCCIEADKYAYHSSSIPVGSLRLPILKNYIKAANTEDGITQALGGGFTGVPDYSAGYTITSGTALTEDALVTCTGSPGGYGTINMSVDGKEVYRGGVSENTARPRAGNIYAAKGSVITSSAGTLTVYPLKARQSGYITLYPWVCAYNAAVPASTAQAAEFQQGLSGKADTNLSNVTSAGKETALNWAMPDLTAGVEVSFPLSTSKFTAPSKGYYYAMGFITSNYSQAVVNGITLALGFWGRTSTNVDGCSMSILLDEGDELYFTYDLSQVLGSSFYPLKGA